MDKLIFHPYSVGRSNEWYRFISCGFIHADFMHLAFNMFSFYMFGDYVEQYFNMLFGQNGKLLYLFLYLSSLAVCLIPTYFQQKDRYNYNSLGASGAVSAIVFAGIFLMPTIQIGFLYLGQSTWALPLIYQNKGKAVSTIVRIYGDHFTVSYS
jgi:membrane associated rhomboid family serine protease